MNLHSITDLSNKKVVNILRSGLLQVQDENLIKNYHPNHDDFSGNLFYTLKNGRYKNSNFFVLIDNGNFVACAGWNPYIYRNQKIALGLTRCYIAENYRRQWLLSKYFLPKIFEETTEYKKIWLTVNSYNHTIYKGFELLSNGRNAGVGESWPKIFNNFSPIGIKTIYFTKQYVIEFNRMKHDK